MKEFTRQDFEEIYRKFTEIPRNDGTGCNAKSSFIEQTFAGQTDYFCRFIGFASATLAYNSEKRAEALELMSDLAMAGLELGREQGTTRAIREYGRECFQFLIEDKVVA